MNASSIGVLGIKFDFVLHYELLEHLPKPSEFVQSIYKNLKEKGRMIFTTPNYLGLEAQALDYNKEERLQVHSIFPPMHLNAFSTQNILYFARINNFRLKYLDTPGKLDFAAVEFCREQMENLDLKEVVKAISVLEDEIKGSIQYLISYLKGSTYMRVVFEK
ncbi:class I SAM-dependent methyltransferase [Helicobacter burdigaliensis]